MQPIAVLDRVSRLVAEDAHALGPRRSLRLEDHAPLETDEPGMDEVERDGDAGNVAGREPFVRQPAVRAQRDLALLQLAIQVVDARFDPRAVEREAEALAATRPAGTRGG